MYRCETNIISFRPRNKRNKIKKKHRNTETVTIWSLNILMEPKIGGHGSMRSGVVKLTG